jgi:chromosome segregation ATPase
MPSLYQLSHEFLAIKAQLEEAEIDEETLSDTLESLQMPIEEKAENVVKYMKELEALAEAKKAEAEILRKAAESDLKKAENLKKYLQDNLNKLGIKKLQAGLFSLSFRKGSEVVEVDENQLPEQYFVPQEPTPLGKSDLKKLIKEGNEIPGVQIVRKPDSLQVKA